MFGFSSGALMTLSDDERHLLVSVVSVWLRRAGGDAGAMMLDAYRLFQPTRLVFFFPLPLPFLSFSPSPFSFFSPFNRCFFPPLLGGLIIKYRTSSYVLCFLDNPESF
ncbi:hypothetical protein [Enterobacter kobei]